MSPLQPFSTSFGGNVPVYSINTTSFLTGATNNPTADAESYARWQRVGTFVTLEFQYQFATVPTTGAMSINLPVPLSPTYPKPQSVWHIRYITGGGQLHQGTYNKASGDDYKVNLVAQTTFHGVPASFTNLSPDTLNVGDVLSGVIMYETA
jgi:hypothetical protein